MLADHLGTGDYTITRVTFVVLLVFATGLLLFAVRAAHDLNRVLCLVASATFAFSAVGMLQRWEDVTNAADRLTGPAGGEIQFSEVDRFVRSVFGDVATFVLLILLVAACLGTIQRHATERRDLRS